MLIADPMSGDDCATLESLAASLLTSVEAVTEAELENEEAQKKIAELTAKVDSLMAQASTLTAQAEQTREIIASYKEIMEK